MGNVESKKKLRKKELCDLGEESYKAFKTWDIGDIIGITGFVFKTRTEEISVHAKEVTLLSKSLRPLPEKFHGLKDVDLRYRQRYVDLIVNPEVKETFILRSKIIREVKARTIKLAIMSTSYAWYGGADIQLPANDKKDVVCEFTMSKETDSNADFVISMGKINGEDTPASDITLSDFSLVKVDETTN